MIVFYRHLCDGKRQCTEGADEELVVCEEHKCPGFFRCVQSENRVCLHTTSICDDFADCLSGEDEYLCEFPGQCPRKCQCLLYAVMCENIAVSNIPMSFRTYVVFLHISSASFTGHPPLFTHTLFLTLTLSNLTQMCESITDSAKDLQLANFALNIITHINEHCLSRNEGIRVLNVSHNMIDTIHALGFHSLKYLLLIDLSFNLLWSFAFSPFLPLHLVALRVENNTFDFVDVQDRMNFTVGITISTDFKLCCALKEISSYCTQKPCWPDSCGTEHTIYQKIIYIFQFGLIFLLNIVGICISKRKNMKDNRLKAKKGAPNPVNKKDTSDTFLLNVLSINANDILFGAYLLCISIATFSYAEHNGYLWKSTTQCKLVAILPHFTIFNSLFLLNLASISRLVGVKYPFVSHFKSMKVTKRYLKTILGVSLLICGLVSVFYHLIERRITMPSFSCSLMGETFNSTTLKVSTLTICLFQTAAFVTVTISYSIIVWELQQPNEISSSSTSLEKSMLIQIILTILSTGFCWLPASAIYVTTVVMDTFPLDVLEWNMAIIIPMTAMLNPFIFTLVPHIKLKLMDQQETQSNEMAKPNK